MRDGNIDPRAFDHLIEGIMTAPEDTVFIVDNGAATFVPISAYMFENDVAAFLHQHALPLVIHSVLTCAQAQGDTLEHRKSVVSGKRVAVRVDLGGRRICKKKIRLS